MSRSGAASPALYPWLPHKTCVAPGKLAKEEGHPGLGGAPKLAPAAPGAGGRGSHLAWPSTLATCPAPIHHWPTLYSGLQCCPGLACPNTCLQRPERCRPDGQAAAPLLALIHKGAGAAAHATPPPPTRSTAPSSTSCAGRSAPCWATRRQSRMLCTLLKGASMESHVKNLRGKEGRGGGDGGARFGAEWQGRHLPLSRLK